MRYTAAAVQFEPQFGDKAGNLERLVALTRQAAQAGARLVVLPEMATTGYRFSSRGEIAPLVEPVPEGPTVRAFEALAAELRIYLAVGLAEVEPASGAYYNTAVLIGPAGYLGQYRKLHSFLDETRWARDGDLGIPVFSTELGRIAMLVCMDAEFMEPFRVAALQGADLIALPTNWLGGRAVWRARAIENGVYLIAANRWGEERGVSFCGHSQVLDPRGAELNLLSRGDGLVLAEVDLDLARASRTKALLARRPDQYQELLINSHLWHWREVQGLPPGRPVAVAVGEATDGARMADQVRWSDKQARDRGWPKLDLAVFPLCEQPVAEEPLAEVARALQAHLVWGAPDGPYLAASLMGPDGQVQRYRQVHPDVAGAPAENGFLAFDLPWGRLGLLVSRELALPEPARLLAKRGADIIAVPARWPDVHDRLLWRVRAHENDTAIAVANAPGGSGIFVPEAKPVAVELGGSLAVTLVDVGSEQIRAKEMLRKLQPHWYGPLTTGWPRLDG